MTLAAEPGFEDIARRLRGLDMPSLDMYKEKCLRRRLAVRMRACGVHTLGEYAALLDRVPGEVARLVAALTINVTQFFRNEDAWDRLGLALRDHLTAVKQGCRGWSAGCSSGEEPYSLAMLLGGLARDTGRSALLDESVIDATDIDEACLARARAGRYALESYGAPLTSRVAEWMVPVAEGVVEVVPAVRQCVRFRRHDLGRDPAPDPLYDVILCRNVVIYFGRETQERLFELFADSLTPGGVLLLGKVETLLGPARDQLEAVDVRERLFRKPIVA